MGTKRALTWTAVSALAVLLVLPSMAGAVILPEPDYDYTGDGFVNSLLSGNVIVFSMPYLNNLAVGDPKPNSGDPFYVVSTPGQIQDLVVIGTGASGTDVTTNDPGFEDPFETPNSSATSSFSTVTASQPGGDGLISDLSGYWDANTAALRAFLGDDECNKLVFWFNQNEQGKGTEQDLYVWMEFLLVDTDTAAATQQFFLSALDDPLTLFDELADGLLKSANLGAPDPTTTPITDTRWSHVHGLITLAADGTFLHFGDVIPGDPAGAYSIAQNLGANNATFAGYIPDLEAEVKDETSPYDTLRIKWVMREINNGYEQLFIMPTCIEGSTQIIPEPASLGIWAVLSLTTGFGAWRSRRKRAA